MSSALTAMLYVPGSSERMLSKVGSLGASAYIVDLEDAVAESAKPAARLLAAQALRERGAEANIWVRVNSTGTGLTAADLEAVVGPGLAGIVLPMAESAHQLLAVDSLIALFEGRSGLREGSVRLMPTIETVAGLANVDEIAAASPRTVCLGFGAGDFSLDVGLDWPPASGQLSPTVIGAKAQLVLASRKAGLDPPHDGVYPNFRKPEVLREEAEQSRALGFHGKHAIHPDQIAVILNVYSPSEADVAEARATLEAYERGLAEGIGGVHIDGRFIDYPVAERARRVLADSGEELPSPLPLEGLRVLDISSLYAAPLISANLGDFGAAVIKVEHPRGDDARRWGLSKDGVPLWWKTISRNKRVIELDLNSEEGRDVVRRLAADSDVLIENFRPGRLEKWGIGPEELHALNPRLVIVRVTGFGQTGPYSDRPGFGTLAEAFSGFAHMTGLADGPPTLPPFGLADAVCGLAGTYATMIALYWRDAAGGGQGQVIDLSLFEPLFSVLGPQITEFTELGVVQGRQGNRSPRTAPRNAYQTSDGRWVALSGGTQQIVNRVLEAIERPELAEDPRFRDAAARRANADEIDSIVADWIAAHSLDEVLAAFEAVSAPIAPAYDTAQISVDPHYLARESFVTRPDPDLGEITMPGIVPRLSRTPGRIRFNGPTEVGADTEAVLGEMGLGGPPESP
jgi:crotonobetainyl-CoA:carnitine CoA-transferase CaiB-like acyl-CoA transferase/citrate lyase beta subunit